MLKTVSEQDSVRKLSYPFTPLHSLCLAVFFFEKITAYISSTHTNVVQNTEISRRFEKTQVTQHITERPLKNGKITTMSLRDLPVTDTTAVTIHRRHRTAEKDTDHHQSHQPRTHHRQSWLTDSPVEIGGRDPSSGIYHTRYGPN